MNQKTKNEKLNLHQSNQIEASKVIELIKKSSKSYFYSVNKRYKKKIDFDLFFSNTSNHFKLLFLLSYKELIAFLFVFKFTKS